MTEFYVSERKTGKTTYLLNWVAELPNYRFIVEPNEAMCKSALRKAEAQGLVIPESQIVPLHRIRGQYIRGVTDAVLGIDNLDHMLYTLFYGTPVEKVTATGIDVLRG